MRNAVRFKTAKFNTTEARDYFINDICFGDDLALWLFENLQNRGLTIAEPWQEDWGWQFEAENVLVSVGFDGEVWSIYFEPALSLFERATGKTADIAALKHAVHETLKNEPDISAPEWFESSKSGQETDFAGAP